MKVAYILGSRANAWHTEVLGHLPPSIAATVVATTGGRYPLDEIASPVATIRWAPEVGWWPLRKLRNAVQLAMPTRMPRLHVADAPLRDFDVLHTWELFTAWTNAALDERARRGTPVVVTVWDNIPGHFADDRDRGPIRRRAIAEADRFLVVTERSYQALLLDGVAAQRIERGYPSVDPERFRPSDSASVRRELGVTNDATVILTIARLEPEKGVRHVLDATALATRRGVRLSVIVVGDGPERGSLERHVTRLGCAEQVHFVGASRYREMARWYQVADVFVLPSIPTPDWQEQWGQSLLEAMSSGTACVASRTGSIGEVMGDAGLLVAAGDPVELADALVRLALDPDMRSDLGRRARHRVLAQFTHRLHADMLTRLYHSVVGEGRP